MAHGLLFFWQMFPGIKCQVHNVVLMKALHEYNESYDNDRGVNYTFIQNVGKILKIIGICLC